MQTRKARKQSLQAEAKKLATYRIPLKYTTETTGVQTLRMWKLKEVPILNHQTEKPVAVAEKVLAHAKEHADTFEYYAFDLSGQLEAVGADPKRLALNVGEAWDLSVALLEENERRKKGSTGKEFIVIVSDAKTLLNLPADEISEKDADKYRNLLWNMEVIRTEATQRGIHMITLDSKVPAKDFSGK